LLPPARAKKAVKEKRNIKEMKITNAFFIATLLQK